MTDAPKFRDYRTDPITVGELIAELRIESPEDRVIFGTGSHFTFRRVKNRAGLVQIEFNELPDHEYALLPSHPDYRP